VVARAPGRLEILGNHTDYNEGVVLSAAVDRVTWVAAAACPGVECRLRDLTHPGLRTFRLDRLHPPVPGDWANYVKGLIVELQARGVPVPAFQAVLASSVPIAAGMSSSAALEMSFALALGRLAGVSLPWQEWARIGQASENRYVGAMTGLLDQFSSLRGRQGHLVYCDFRTLDVRNVPLPAGTALVVANSMVKHTLTGEYNERRARCHEAADILARRDPRVRALRDVTRPQLEAARSEMDPVTYRRALHVVGEIERVEAGVGDLTAGDVAAFGRRMGESHASSQLNFENSSAELDALVALSRTLPGVFGARLSGGGFGGITVHLVAAAGAAEYCTRLASAYAERLGIQPEAMICQPADGADIVE